jgi:DNA repair exonuclease SbcCD ATPase subunit
VFDRSYDFEIRFNRKRGKSNAELIILKDGQALMNPLHESGFGVLDVASFALRVASLVLSKRKLRKLLVLDEPFKHVNRRHYGSLKTLIETLATELEIQFIIVTHISSLELGKVVYIGDADGEKEEEGNSNRI